MTSESVLTSNTPLAGLTLDVLEVLVATLGEPRYRAAQIFHAVQREGRTDAAAITTLPKALRERLAAESGPSATRVVETQSSSDGTKKFLLALHDGKRVETVLIPEGRRRTVCVSTQVGCPIRCLFCASGIDGLIRNLETAEIVEQLLHVAGDLGERPTNIVLMGMGEPLLNYDAVVRAIRLWTHPSGLNFSPRRITVSAAGSPAPIDRLAEEELGVSLAVSLHAADDETRTTLVPGSPARRTRALIDAATRYATRTGRDATIEYVLIHDHNDQRDQAERLAAAVRGRHLHVNLIPLNPVPHQPQLRAPPHRVSTAFASLLQKRGVSVTLRTQRGEDIAAACGQLALERALAEPAQS